MGIIGVIATTLLLAGGYFLPIVPIGRWLVTKGVVQTLPSWKSLGLNAIGIFGVLAYFGLSVDLPFNRLWLIIGAPVWWWATLKGDIWTTIQRGRWWWVNWTPERQRSEDNRSTYRILWLILALIILVPICIWLEFSR